MAPAASMEYEGAPFLTGPYLWWQNVFDENFNVPQNVSEDGESCSVLGFCLKRSFERQCN